MPKILVASDAPTVRREIVAALASSDTEVLEASSGPDALATIRNDATIPDLLIVDMQMGNMGAVAVTMELSLEESYLEVNHVPVLILLDRRPDVFLARRAGAEGWLVKPLDPLRLRRAVRALLEGGEFADAAYTPSPVLVS